MFKNQIKFKSSHISRLSCLFVFNRYRTNRAFSPNQVKLLVLLLIANSVLN